MLVVIGEYLPHALTDYDVVDILFESRFQRIIQVFISPAKLKI